MRRFALALALSAPLAGAAPPQESTRAEELSAPVFGTEVNYVEVDAFVMDEQGEFLRNLTRDDFEIFEEGVRQEITAFTEIAIPIERPEQTFVEPTPRDIATNERPFGGRIYVLLLDETHTDPRRSGVARQLASQFIEEQLADDDIAAVVLTGDRADAGQMFTSDKRLLLEAVARFTGRKPPSATAQRLSLIEFQKDTVASLAREEAETFAPIRGRDLDPADLERTYHARKSMDTLKNIARGLGAARGRRKAILYFSEGIDYNTLDVMRREQRDASAVLDAVKDAMAVATRHSVAVYPIDPRGLIDALGPDDIRMAAPLVPDGVEIDSETYDQEVQRSLDSLRTLATETGGIAVLDTNDYTRAFDSIVRANSRYYLLGYYPSDFRRDGEFRRIEVRVRRPGVTVVARDGYVRPREDEEDRPGTLASADTSREVRELLDRPWAQTGLTLGVTAAVFKGKAENASVAVTIQLSGRGLPFRQQGDRAVNEIEVSLIAIDQEGRSRGGDRMLVQPRLRAQTRDRVERLGMRFVRRLDLPPGRYQLRVAARETEQGKRGSVFYDLEVPDFREGNLSMSGVLLTSRRAQQTLTASVDDQVEELLRTPPTVARAFSSDDIVTVYAEIYDRPEPVRDVTLTARLTNADGQVVFRATDERSTSELDVDGGLAHEVVIPLSKLNPGPYLLEIEADPMTGESAAARALSFDILPGSGRRASGDELAPPWVSPDPDADTRRPSSRVDRLEAWLAAVEKHEPGTGDRSARLVRAWAPGELIQLAADLAMMARLIEDPDHPVLWAIDPNRPTRFQRTPYTTADEKRLRAAAKGAALHCVEELSAEADPTLDEEQVRCARNWILKRGAVLHTDAAIHVTGKAAAQAARQRRPDRWRIRFTDGQQRGAEGAPGHWELARSLLDNVAPDPERDPSVRLWYIATSAHGQYHESHTRHEDDAVDLFPEDAELLFLAGCLHETFASPKIQSLARSIRVSGASHGIDSRKSELRTAEELFRRALEADPELIEARIRLGRVLHLLGKPEQATRELRQAVVTLLSEAEGADTAVRDASLMLYFAEMFHGAAVEELGQHDTARASYSRAAELFPEAQSPRLALSQLALRGYDHDAALDGVRQALQSRGGGRDPWWQYHSVQGRDSAAWFARLHESIVEP